LFLVVGRRTRYIPTRKPRSQPRLYAIVIVIVIVIVVIVIVGVDDHQLKRIPHFYRSTLCQREKRVAVAVAIAVVVVVVVVTLTFAVVDRFRIGTVSKTHVEHVGVQDRSVFQGAAAIVPGFEGFSEAQLGTPLRQPVFGVGAYRLWKEGDQGWFGVHNRDRNGPASGSFVAVAVVVVVVVAMFAAARWAVGSQFPPPE